MQNKRNAKNISGRFRIFQQLVLCGIFCCVLEEKYQQLQHNFVKLLDNNVTIKIVSRGYIPVSPPDEYVR